MENMCEHRREKGQVKAVHENKQICRTPIVNFWKEITKIWRQVGSLCLQCSPRYKQDLVGLSTIKPKLKHNSHRPLPGLPPAFTPLPGGGGAFPLPWQWHLRHMGGSINGGTQQWLVYNGKSHCIGYSPISSIYRWIFPK